MVLYMKEKIIIFVMATMLLTSTLQMINVYGLDINKPINQDSQSMPQQKISPQLIEKLKELGVSNPTSNDLVRILVRYNPNVKVKLPEEVKVLKRFSLIPVISALAPASSIEEISKLPGVEYACLDLEKKISSNDYPQLPTPDYSNIVEKLKTAKVVNQELPYNPWYGQYPAYLNETTKMIGAQELWAQGITGKNVIMAIVDTGINKNHPDLDDMDDNPTTHDPKVLAEASFVDFNFDGFPDEPPDDWNGHGTHVASIAAGTGGTGGMGFYGTFPYESYHNVTILPGTECGVAPGAYLLNAKAFSSGGSGYDSWIISAIEWSVEHGADIISGSFGGWPTVPPEQDPVVLALKEAVNHGVVVVIAAGNEGFGYFSVASPGFAPEVITVGAISETDYLIAFSSRGPEEYELHAKPDIVAPGVCVVAAYAMFKEAEASGWPQTFYLEISGTSMATPHVSGAAALLLEAFPGATPYTVKSAIMLGADDLNLDPMAQGAGRLNVKKAYDIMNLAPKTKWSAPIPTNTFELRPPVLMAGLNLTGKSILVENSFSDPSKISLFTVLLSMSGASVHSGWGPYINDGLVNATSGKPYYDVFIIPQPYLVNSVTLPPSVLNYYVQHNGTVLFIGDMPNPPYAPKDYNSWTGIWGITWNNTAVGGRTTHIDPHNITSGITELYFGDPLASLIVNTTMGAKSVVWDPVFPGVAVWETPAPAKGKVVVISDDGVLSDQCLFTADNLQLGLNIIKWFTAAPELLIHGLAKASTNIESPHPYPSNAYLTYSISQPGAFGIMVHFPKIELEYGYDYLLIYDKNWNLMTYFTGFYYNVWTPLIIGDTVNIVLESDFTFSYWGFVADYYLYVTGFGIVPPAYHEIGIGGTLPKYAIANTTTTLPINVTNFGTCTENVTLYLNGVNVKNVTNLAPKTSKIAEIKMKFNATLICDESGVNVTTIDMWGSIPEPEIDYTNNGFSTEIAAVPKGERKGDNPLLSVITPMKIDSTSAPLITMYPKDFTLHNMTAFVGGGELVDAKFQITGSVSQIADFINVTDFTYHTTFEMLPDPSPAYFKPNMTAIIGDTLSLGNVSAPAMLFAELQVYINENTPTGTYIGQVELVNGTTTIASASLSFEVKKPKCRVLWEDYYNDYENSWGDCERLWGGAVWGLGVFEWWKLVSQAGFDVDSLHQQLYFKQHIGYLGKESVDPLEIIAYGGYNVLYMHDVGFNFNPDQISVFRQLYESGKMDFVVLFDGGSEAMSSFTSYYGINASWSWVYDLVITGFDKTHPIFNGVQNFTLYDGPFLTIEPPEDTKSVTTGIATGTNDWGYPSNGFVVAVNEMHATPHLTSRMITVSDSNTFEYLEYANFMVWYTTWFYTGKGEVVSRVDTDNVAVNMLEWLDPQYANEPPAIDYFDVTPTTAKLGETVSVDVVAHDPEDDSFNVTIAIQKPDNTWNNATVPPVGGHWLRSVTIDLEGGYDIYVIATDSYGATTSMLIGTVNAVNMPPEIVSASISPTKVTQGENVFITLNTKDVEDGVPASIKVSVIAPNGSSYDYNFTNMGFVTLIFDTSNKPAGIYNVNASVKDSNNAQTTATIGFFEVEPIPPEPAAPFPIREATFGISIIGLVALILILLLIIQRFPGKPKTP